MKTLYTAHGTSTGGRAGKVETDDKRLSFQLSSPGSGGQGTNPEQLFACGYSACFGSAIEFAAKQQKIILQDIQVQADVTLNQDDNGFFIGVALNVLLPEVDTSTAQAIVKAAHQICPYSKATRGNIDVTLKVNDATVD